MSRRSAAQAARSRRRRWLLAGGAVLAIGGGTFAAIETGLLDEPLRELTLPLRHEDIIRQESAQWDVPADLVAAVIFRESHFTDQTSPAGARGLMQITPDTAELIEHLSGGQTFETEDLADPDINISYGTFYLRHLLDRFGGNVVAALAGYNAGPETAEAWGGAGMSESDIQFAETRDYVATVLNKRRDYRDTYEDELGL